MKLSILQILQNPGERQMPWQASLRSALHFADEVIVCECYSTDGTVDVLSSLMGSEWCGEQESRLRIIHPACVGATDKECADLLSAEARGDWQFLLDPNEVIQPTSQFRFEVIEEMSMRFASANYVHLVDARIDESMFTIRPRMQKGNIAPWDSAAFALVPAEGFAVLPVYVHHYTQALRVTCQTG